VELLSSAGAADFFGEPGEAGLARGSTAVSFGELLEPVEVFRLPEGLPLPLLSHIFP
jgi:hypothetical protein